MTLQNPFEDAPGKRPPRPAPKRLHPLPKPVQELPAEELLEEREAGEFQEPDAVPAFEIAGFPGFHVVATLEKKDSRKHHSEDRNQDNILADPETGLIGVFDGLGGSKAGAIASLSAERAFPMEYKNALHKLEGVPTTEVVDRLIGHQLIRMDIKDRREVLPMRKRMTEMMEQVASIDPTLSRRALALIDASREVNTMVRETQGQTTACLGFIHTAPDGRRFAAIINLGDSAAFKRHADGRVERITKEDDMVDVFMRDGQLTPDLLHEMQQSPNSPRAFFLYGKKHEFTYARLKASMSACLGSTDDEPSLEIWEMKPGEELFFATDGIVDKFDDPKTNETNVEHLGKALSHGRTLAERMTSLRRASKLLKTYKKDDDIAVVAATITA